MALEGEGIWVRLTMADGSRIRGWATGAESPNDFWSKFRTQLIRLEHVRHDGEDEEAVVYVNRDSIVLAEVEQPEAPG